MLTEVKTKWNSFFVMTSYGLIVIFALGDLSRRSSNYEHKMLVCSTSSSETVPDHQDVHPNQTRKQMHLS